MNNQEAREMMQRCADEIKQLRRRIDELAPKADAYDMIRTVLLGQPTHGDMAPDVVWVLEDAIKRAEEEEAAERVAPAKPKPATEDEFLDRMAAEVGPLSEHEKAKALTAEATKRALTAEDDVLKRGLAKARAEAGDEMVEDQMLPATADDKLMRR